MIYRYPRPPILASIPRDHHAVLEASAGTGKTYTIEHLVVDRIIATDATLAQILVVTFTEKATAELKTRIRALIERIIEDAEVAQQPPESHGEDNDWWYFDVGVKHKLEQELFSFDHAPIYTMHGFCHRLLTEMAFNSGQSFGQSQIDTDVIFERVWRDAVRHEFATDPECQETLIRWHKSSAGDGELMGLIRDAHKQGYLRNRLDIDTEVHSLRTRLRTHYNTTAYVEEVAQLAVQKRGLDAMALVGVELESALGMDVSPDEFLNVVSKLELKSLIKPPRSRVTETKLAYPDGLSEHQLNNRSDIHQLWRLVELLNTSERRDVDQLLTTLTKMLDARKELERLFEFDDLLNRVHDALTDPDNATLVTLLRERFRFGLIDEFQDTDDKQWDIFRRIFVGHPNGALYIIGDPKQAIYGFRGADIHTYLAARDSLLSNPDQPAARVPLNMNYRSTPAMINAVNTILDADGPHRLLSGPIRYDEPVECGRPTLRLVDKSGNDIEPLTIWSRTVPPTGNRKSPSGASVMRAYLDDLVATIEQLLDPSEGYFIHEDGSSPKRLNGSDIFVLVRTGTEATLVTQTLRAAGITTARKSGQKIFQTHVCDDVIRLLTAISRPQQRSARMGLFYSAFIDIGPEQIAAFADETATESLMDIISGWRRLAERGDYGALWRRVAVETGLLVRELHNPKGEQFLTVAGQIFETIVEVFGHRGAPIEDVIEHLTRWRNGIDIPDGIETGLRLAADDNAVQVMTIHKSKGLQAGVVFLLGGFGRAPSKRIRTVNHAGQRHVVVGKGACEAFKDLLNAQAAEEDERLLYVGLTRAIAKMYLVTVHSRGPVDGPYERLNSRLKALLSEPRFERSFAIIDADHSPPQRPVQTATRSSENSLRLHDPSDRSLFDALRAEHPPWIVTSYSAMKEKGNRDQAVADFGKVVIDEIIPIAGPTDEALSTDITLPGGKHMGRFLHEVIEAIEFHDIASMTQEDWADDDAVLEAFQITMRRHGVDPQWLNQAQRLVHRSLTRPIRFGEFELPPLSTRRCLREMEFVFPIPEKYHPLLSTTDDALETTWQVDRGLIKGFIDLTFEHDDRLYWLDWKSDKLSVFTPASIEAHTHENYGVQARIYTIGLIRLLGITNKQDYEARFGGYIYLYMRGCDHRNSEWPAVFSHRPDWETVVQWERALIHDPSLPSVRRESAGE